MKINSNTLSYTGIVDLKIIDTKTKKVKKSIITHNDGTPALFYFLCNCLAKNYDRIYAPSAIDASDTPYDSNGTLTSILAYRVLLSKPSVHSDVTYKYDGETQITFDYCTRFSAIIPNTAMRSNVIKNLQLHSSIAGVDSVGSLIAWVNIGGDEGITVNTGESLLVEWNMGFKDPTSTTAPSESNSQANT